MAEEESQSLIQASSLGKANLASPPADSKATSGNESKDFEAVTAPEVAAAKQDNQAAADQTTAELRDLNMEIYSMCMEKTLKESMQEFYDQFFETTEESLAPNPILSPTKHEEIITTNQAEIAYMNEDYLELPALTSSSASDGESSSDDVDQELNAVEEYFVSTATEVRRLSTRRRKQFKDQFNLLSNTRRRESVDEHGILTIMDSDPEQERLDRNPESINLEYVDCNMGNLEEITCNKAQKFVFTLEDPKVEKDWCKENSFTDEEIIQSLLLMQQNKVPTFTKECWDKIAKRKIPCLNRETLEETSK